MKKMMSVLVVLAIVCGVSSSALSESRVAVVRNGETFKVIYKNSETANVKVTISDAEGVKVFSEELVSIKGFIRPYNFAEMPKGDYTICVTDLDGKKTEKVCFEEERFTKEREAKHTWLAHISKLPNQNKKVMVAIPQQKENNFSIQIFDKDDQLIYTEDQKLETAYAKVFNFKGLDESATIHLVNHVTGETKYFKAE
jgi:hypothetical protein